MADNPLNLRLSDDPVAKFLYQEIKGQGVSNQDIDQGFYVVQSPKEPPKLVGKGDGAIQPQEVYEYALSNYEKYQDIVERTTKLNVFWGFPLPQQQSSKVKMFLQNLEGITSDIKNYLKQSKIEPNDPHSFMTTTSAFGMTLARGNSRSEKRIAAMGRQYLRRAGLASLISRLEATGKTLFSGKTDCPDFHTLTEFLEQDCKPTDLLKLLTLYQISRLSGFKPSWGIFKMKGHDRPNVLIFARDDKGIKFIYPFLDQEEVEWHIPSPRTSLTKFYLGEAQESGLTAKSGELIKKALLLSPEDPGSRFLYGLWLYQGPEKKMAQALSYLQESLKLFPWDFGIHVHLGKIYFRGGQLEAAEKEFRLFLESSTDEKAKATVAADLGELLLQSNRKKEAIEMFNEVVALNPKNTKLRDEFSIILIKKGEFGLALEQVKAVLSQEPGNSLFQFRLGWLYSQLGRNEEAKKAYERALKLNPKSLEPYQGLTSIYIEEKQINKAERINNQALKFYPSDVHILGQRATILKFNGQIGEALKLLESLFAKGIDDAGLRLNAGGCLIQMNRFEEAVVHFKKVIELKPADTMQSHFELAIAYTALRDASKALQEFQQMNVNELARNERFIYHYTSAVALLEKGEYKKALEQTEKAVAIDNRMPDPFVVRAAIKTKVNQFDEALEEGRLLRQRWPRDPRGYFLLAQIFHEKGDHDQEINTLEEALNLFPSDANVHTQLALTYLEVGKKNEAEKVILTMKKKFEKDPKARGFAYALHGELYRLGGKQDAAIAEYKTAVEFNPDLFAAQASLGTLLLYEGEMDKAEEAFRNALRLFPDSPTSKDLDNASPKGKKYPNTIAIFQRLLALSPNNAEAYSQLGNAFFREGDYVKALQYNDKALKLAPTSSAYHYIRGLIFATQGQYDKAIVALKEALKHDSNNVHAAQLLTEVTQAMKGQISPAAIVVPGSNETPILLPGDQQGIDLWRRDTLPPWINDFLTRSPWLREP